MTSPLPDSRVLRAAELLRGYDPLALESAAEFFGTRSGAALDRLVVAVLELHLPPQPAGSPKIADRPAAVRLVEDLAFDSLALVEMVFLLDDLLQLKIPEEELRDLRTLGDLQSVVRRHARAI